jgi:hypothetical protein
VISAFDSALGSLRSTLSRLIESVRGSPGPVYGWDPSQQGPSQAFSRAPVRLIVDLGADPRRRPLNPFSAQAFSSMDALLGVNGQGQGHEPKGKPFSMLSRGGVSFEIEAYYDALHPVGSVSSATTGSGSLSKAFTPSSPPPAATRNEFQQCALSTNLRRHKGFVGILIDGGHFEHLMQSCITSNRGTQDDLIAVGMRVKVDALGALLLKTEEKRLEAEERSTKAFKKNSRSAEKEKGKDRIADGAGSSVLSSADGRLSAFVSKFSTAPPDVILLQLKMSHSLSTSDNAGDSAAGLYATAAQMRLSDRDHRVRKDVSPGISPPIHSTPIHSSSPPLVAVTLTMLRVAGVKALDLKNFPSDRTSRLLNPSSLISCDAQQGEVEQAIVQCSHASVPFLVLLPHLDEQADADDFHAEAEAEAGPHAFMDRNVQVR